jgi:hypothetical protein
VAPKVPSILRACAVSVGSLVANFSIFVFSYNRLATPFLVEEQRVTNANFILTVTLGGFVLVACITGVVVYWMLRRQPAPAKR